MYFFSGTALAAGRVRPVDWAQHSERRSLMKSRKKILAGMVAMALGSGAYAATFEGRLACDQDPREAATSCMLFVPVTDAVGLPVYTQQISVTYLLEPRGEAAAGMEFETQTSTDISASGPAAEIESFSSKPEIQSSFSLSDSPSVYPRDEVAEGTPPFSDYERQASSSRGIFSWLTGERGSRACSSDPRSTDWAARSLMEEGDPPFGEHERLASSPSRTGIFSWLTGERKSSSLSEQPAEGAAEEGPDHRVMTDSNADRTAD
jgi:hypothetical protein